MKNSTKRFAASLLVVLLSACATAGTTGSGTSPTGTVGQNPTNPSEIWGIKTREHLDLWLHGFAMVQEDSSLIPYFRRGYKSNMQAVKTRSNIITQLDANNAKLHSRFGLNAQLVNAQFLPLYFDNFNDLANAVDLAYRAGGDPRQAGNQQDAETIALVAGYFPTEADRDWARLFIQSLRDEDTRFYKNYWDQQQRELGAVFSAVNDLW